jgi:hypothetical protein
MEARASAAIAARVAHEEQTAKRIRKEQQETSGDAAIYWFRAFPPADSALPRFSYERDDEAKVEGVTFQGCDGVDAAQLAIFQELLSFSSALSGAQAPRAASRRASTPVAVAPGDRKHLASRTGPRRVRAASKLKGNKRSASKTTK